MKKKSLSLFTGFISIVLFITSCTPIDVFEKNVTIPSSKWEHSFTPKITFEISDTSTDYAIYTIIRHRDAYNYNNIWLNITTKAPNDSAAHNQKLDIQLGSDDKGWFGTGLDDIWEYRKIITRGPYRFKQQGTYTFSISQIMRENPLQNILSVGIRVEKIK